MRILFLCWEYPPVGSGIGVYVAQMVRALTDAGHEAVVVTSRIDSRNGITQPGQGPGIVYRVYEQTRAGQHELAETVLEIASRHEVDWIEVPDHLGEGAPLLGLARRPPVVVKCHYNDAVPRIRYAQARWWWQRPLIDLACFRDRRRLERERVSLARADGLLYITGRTAAETERAGLTLSARKAVVPNPVEPLSGWANEEATHPTLLFVGRVDFGKGVDYLPGILRLASRSIPDVRIELAGGDGYARGVGSIRCWLERRFAELSDRVTFLGHIAPQQLDAAYKRAWVVLVPSRWDTFPMAVLEAMARGKAIVASPNGGMPEMLADTANPIADPMSPSFADAVVKLLSDARRRREAGLSGRRRSLDLYSPERIVRSYIEAVSPWL